MARLLPLFPLQLVVFPGSVVPLHIFEDRYKEMVGAAEAAGTEFGIVLARDNGILNAGCTVLVESVLRRYPDGRFDVLTRGQRRFVIKSLNQEKDYLRGEVEFYSDEDPESAPPELRRAAILANEKMRHALSAGEPDEASEAGEANEENKAHDQTPDLNHPFLSFQLAENIDDLDFRNTIQRSRSEAERLRAFTSFTEEYVTKKQYAARMKRVVQTNGFGHPPTVH